MLLKRKLLLSEKGDLKETAGVSSKSNRVIASTVLMQELEKCHSLLSRKIFVLNVLHTSNVISGLPRVLISPYAKDQC